MRPRAEWLTQHELCVLTLIYPQGAARCHQQAQCTEHMETANQTGMIHFHFRPFSKLPGVQVLIFVAFLIMYLVSISGNVSISLIIWISRSLHTPMYFFLANLAVLEICYSSTIAPLTLASVLSPERALVSLPCASPPPSGSAGWWPR